MAEKVDKVKLWHLIFVVFVSVSGTAASWGANKVELSTAKADVKLVKQELTEANKDVEALKISGAVTNETLKNIDQKLSAISIQIEKLNEKLDKLKK